MSDVPGWTGEAIFLLGVLCGLFMFPVLISFAWAVAKVLLIWMHR